MVEAAADAMAAAEGDAGSDPASDYWTDLARAALAVVPAAPASSTEGETVTEWGVRNGTVIVAFPEDEARAAGPAGDGRNEVGTFRWVPVPVSESETAGE